MVTVAVCLSGCGYRDGSEIHEAVQTILALDLEGAKTLLCAPDIRQSSVVDHLTGKAAGGEERNVLAESARIARGNVLALSKVTVDRFDALILPGGFGAANNLCSFAGEGADCQVLPEVERLIDGALDAGKPIGAICIAPALVARVLGKRRTITLTIGNEAGVAKAIERMGCKHRECKPGGIVIDEKSRVVTTPAYMYGDSPPAKIFEGIQALVREVLRMAGGR
jgi:enhancing lycopene biosynthesis protein 2